MSKRKRIGRHIARQVMLSKMTPKPIKAAIERRSVIVDNLNKTIDNADKKFTVEQIKSAKEAKRNYYRRSHALTSTRTKITKDCWRQQKTKVANPANY